MNKTQSKPVYFQELLTIGTAVEVSDPKHQESMHRNGFVATVAMPATDDGVVVMDYEGTGFEVSLDEILLIEDYTAEADVLCVAKVTDDRWHILLVTTMGEIIPQAIVHTQAMALEILNTFNNREGACHA